MYVRQALFIYASHHLILAAIKGARKFIYSYFEKGCRKKCTRKSEKVLWVVLSSLFFKEFERMALEAMDICLRVLQESTTNKFGSYNRQEQCIDHISCYLSGLSRAHFFRQPFSK